MLAIYKDLQFLPTDFVRLRPFAVVFSQDLGIDYDFPELLQYDVRDVNFFSDERVRLVLAIIGIPEPAVWLEFEFQELVAEFAFVAHANVIKNNS